MIAFFSSWAQNIIVAVIIATIIELILPSGTSKKYVKVIIGVYILFAMISPAIEKFAGNKFNINEIFNTDEYDKKINEAGKNLSKQIEENNNRRIKDVYISNMKSDITTKLKQRGYNVTNTYIKIQNNEDYEIEQISLTVKKDNNLKESNLNEENNTINEIKINSVNKIEIGNNQKNSEDSIEKNTLSNEDINNIKDFVSEEYGLEKEKIEVLS